MIEDDEINKLALESIKVCFFGTIFGACIGATSSFKQERSNENIEEQNRKKYLVNGRELNTGERVTSLLRKNFFISG